MDPAPGLPGRLPGVGAITVFLTGECNLACAYCYQTRSVAPGPMTPATRRACAALSSTLGPEGEVVITGGEPLREFEALEELTLELERATGPEERPTLGVISNGLLLERRIAAFLARHRIELQLSFDGTPAAQARRGKASFEAVERRLEMLLEEWPEWSARRLSVAITLDAKSVPELAEAVIGLLERGVSRILVAPMITPDGSWCEATRRELRRQVERIVARSVEHYRETGAIPVDFLRADRAGEPGGVDADTLLRGDTDREGPAAGGLLSARRPRCAASSISTLAIDPRGHCWACPALVGSLRRVPDPARDLGRLFDLGPLDEGLPRRLEAARRRAARCDDLFASPRQRSAGGRCETCRWYAACSVCPAAVRANDGAFEVPSNTCHLVQETCAAAEAFHHRLPEIRLRAAMRRWTDSLRRMQRALEDHAVSEGAVGDPPHPPRGPRSASRDEGREGRPRQR